VSKDGRTILFVSHNMSAVKELCRRGIYLSNGKIGADSSMDETIKHYTGELAELAHFQNGQLHIKNKNIYKLELLSNNVLSDFVNMGNNLTFRVYFKSQQQLHYPVLGLVIKDYTGTSLIAINNKHYVGNVTTESLHAGIFEINFPEINLMSGDYLVDLYLGNEHNDFEVLKECCVIRIDRGLESNAPESPKPELNKIFYKNVGWKVTNLD